MEVKSRIKLTSIMPRLVSAKSIVLLTKIEVFFFLLLFTFFGRGKGESHYAFLPGTFYINQAGFDHREIHMSLPSKYWDHHTQLKMFLKIKLKIRLTCNSLLLFLSN